MYEKHRRFGFQPNIVISELFCTYGYSCKGYIAIHQLPYPWGKQTGVGVFALNDEDP